MGQRVPDHEAVLQQEGAVPGSPAEVPRAVKVPSRVPRGFIGHDKIIADLDKVQFEGEIV